MARILEWSRRSRRDDDDGSYRNPAFRTRRADRVTVWDWIAYIRRSGDVSVIRPASWQQLARRSGVSRDIPIEGWRELLGIGIQTVLAARRSYLAGIPAGEPLEINAVSRPKD